jgi:hypothetical protein
MKKRYYVYAHYNNNNELFYIGKGTNNRDEDPTMRNQEWLNEARNGFTSKVIADDLNNKQAFLIEQAVIRALENDNLTNKKIPGDIVIPYWKKPNKPQHHIHSNTNIDDAITILENKIKLHSLSQKEIDFLQLPKDKLNKEEKKSRQRLLAKRYKLTELEKRLKRAKELTYV